MTFNCVEGGSVDKVVVLQLEGCRFDVDVSLGKALNLKVSVLMYKCMHVCALLVSTAGKVLHMFSPLINLGFFPLSENNWIILFQTSDIILKFPHVHQTFTALQ